MPKNNSGTLIGGLLVGSAIGTVLGLLSAPRTGKETRTILKKSVQALPEIAEDLSSSVQLQADRLSVSAVNNWDGTLNRLREALSAGVEASRLEAQSLKQGRQKKQKDSSANNKS